MADLTAQRKERANIMRNGYVVSLKMKRIDICDLLLACTITKHMSNDDGKKWDSLYNTLKEQLDKFDSHLTK